MLALKIQVVDIKNTLADCWACVLRSIFFLLRHPYFSDDYIILPIYNPRDNPIGSLTNLYITSISKKHQNFLDSQVLPGSSENCNAGAQFLALNCVFYNPALYYCYMIGSAKRISVIPRAFTPSFCDDGYRVVKQINQYRLVSRLGAGASSKVFLGVDQNTGEKYAIKRIRLKELSRSGTGLQQLEREIRLMRQFDHPNILKLYEVLHIPQTQEAFLVMEYAEKGCLGSFCERYQQLSTDAIFSILKQVATAIKYLHDHGFVHQDIKPWNILLGNDGRAILADFGIGHSFQSAAMVVGSPAFQAPEALDESYYSEDGEEFCPSSDEAPQKEDIWALGVTLYQLLFLRLPFLGNNLYEIVSFIKHTSLQIPPDTDEAIASLLRQMLSVDPNERISVRALLENPLVANAPDLAAIPDVPVCPAPIDGSRVVGFTAKVCPPGYSFACSVMSPQARLAHFQAPFSATRSLGNSLKLDFSMGSSDELEVDDEEHGFPPRRTLTVPHISL